ncbi:MAG: M42 family metallopeptidase [Oscillospiraceae bacterium]|nr:M42 family metallopeptidase [Oscillospiraceae bacterium]
MYAFDEAYCLKTFETLLGADSTTGQYEEVQKLLCAELDALGCPYQVTHKGGVIADLGGEGNALAVTAHLDDIGLMVRKLNKDGTLNVCPVGGLYPFYCMMENVRVHTRDGKVFTGTVCRSPNSIHVTEEELRVTPPDFRTNVCVVLDEDVKDEKDVRALGVETGDMVALEPRFTRSGGYIKSHFVDDKACAAVLLTVIRALREGGVKPDRRVYFYFAMFEELGHGTAWLPEGVRDMLAVDIAPTGPDQNSDEHKVSLFAKDSRFPYHWGLTNELRETAIRYGVDYVMDVFTPHYGTDCDGSVLAGYDIRHAAIGPGTANSHGYERTHVEGLKNTYKLLLAYIAKIKAD